MKPTLSDRVVGWFSPESQLRRMQARAAIAVASTRRGYDGARVGRRTDGWKTANTSANAEILRDVARVRQRSRDLVRNNPRAARAVSILASNIVGDGITPRVRSGDADLDKRVMDLWRRFADQSDARGRTDIYGLQHLAVRSMIEGGEGLARFRRRYRSDRLAVPLQIQLLEAEHLDASRNDPDRAIKQGISFNPIGAPRSYWIFPEHPGDTFRPSLVPDEIQAYDIAHLFREDRPGQIRGVPWLAPVIVALRDLGDFEEAALVKAKIEACFAAFVTSPDGEDALPLASQSTNDQGDTVETLEPGMVERLRPGEDIRFASPTASGGFEPFALHMLMSIAAGIGLTYDQMTGDLRQANYSSLRAGKIELRRMIADWQYKLVVPQLCRPIWSRFLDAARLVGAIPEDLDVPVTWIAPRHEAIDPGKETAATIQEIRGGLKPWSVAVTEAGWDPDEVLAEIAKTNGQLDAAGIVLDSDPRLRTANGSAVSQGQPAEQQEMEPADA